jgi:hypothetical protein
LDKAPSRTADLTFRLLLCSNDDEHGHLVSASPTLLEPCPNQILYPQSLARPQTRAGYGGTTPSPPRRARLAQAAPSRRRLRRTGTKTRSSTVTGSAASVQSARSPRCTARARSLRDTTGVRFLRSTGLLYYTIKADFDLDTTSLPTPGIRTIEVRQSDTQYQE